MKTIKLLASFILWSTIFAFDLLLGVTFLLFLVTK